MAKEGHIFQIEYHGDAVNDGSMDVRDFAPALLALGELLSDSNKIVNSSKSDIRLEIKATERNSFIAELFVSFYQNIVELFSQEDTQAIGTLLAYLGISGKDAIKGLFQLILFSKGKEPKQVIKLGNGGSVQFDFGDGRKIEVHAPTAKLYADTKIRKHISNVVKPLKQKGIDSLEIKHQTEKSVEILKDEIISFEPPDVADEIITDITDIKVFSIVSLAFKENNKWKISDGSNDYYVTIKDFGFLQRVQKDVESFSIGSLLRLKLRTIQLKTDTGLRTEYEVVEVVEHISSHKQMNLPFNEQ